MENKKLELRNIKYLANWIIRIAGTVIFLILTWYSFRFTQYMLPVAGYEYPIDRKDSVGINLLFLILFGALCIGVLKLEQRLSQRIQMRIRRGVLIFSMLVQGIGGFLWIAAADRCPKGDQEAIYKSAIGFLNGDFHALTKGGYCGLYPHQIGLAAIEEGIFRLTKSTDYRLVQYLFVFLCVGICFFVYKILTEMTEHNGIVVLGTWLAGICFLPVFYSSWLYGEVPYVFFALLAAWMLARYAKSDKTGDLIGFVVAVTLAMLVRKNALILVVAGACVAVVAAVARKNYRILIAVVCAFLIPTLCYEGLFKMYELRSGIEHSEGLPSNDFVYIGLVETEGGRYGWDFYPSTQVYYDNGKDPEKTREAVNVLLAERWQEMTAEPGYLKLFFKGKMLSQWNAPLYQAMYFNYVHEEVHMPKVAAFLDRFSGEWFEGLLWAADRMQFIVYVGMLLYFVLVVRRDSNILQHMLAVTIIGGFFFSLMWEAKTRYIFPYYMMMFPLAVLGYEKLVFLIKKRYNNVL